MATRTALEGTRRRSKAPAAAASNGAGATKMPAGAVAAPLPDRFAPELATLVASAPTDANWSYEVKFDGYRILARIDGDDVRLVSRNGNDWTAKLGGIAEELRGLGIGSAWLDGEIVVLNPSGASDFGKLQRAFEAGGHDIRYFVFDLPYCSGHDLRAARLEDRRAVLEGLLAQAAGKVRFSASIEAAAATDILRNACRLHLEGVIGKRLGSAYVSRRSSDWIKLKCTLRQEFVIGGYTEPQGSRSGIGALLLGIHDAEGRLRFAGSVGTGFDAQTLLELRRALTPLETASTAFFEKPREAKGTWVEPKLVAEVSFAEWTRDGKVRHAVFHGLRSDKPAIAIAREEPAPVPRGSRPPEAPAQARGKPAASAPPAEAPRNAAATASANPKAAMASANANAATAAANVKAATAAAKAKAATTPASAKAAGAPAETGAPGDATADTPASPVRITNPQRVIDKSTQHTKRDLVDYYLHAARRILPHLARRPVALVRAPSGIAGPHFFQKHVGSLHIEDIVELPASMDPGNPPLIEIDSFVALISAAQMNVVEFHTWNATSRSIEKPDRMTFDLDPGEGVEWAQIAEAARMTKSALDELGLRSFLKTSGGKGLHVVVPLTPREGWDEVKDFSRAIVERLVTLAPDRLVAKSGPKNRVGKIFVDYLRNGRGATTAAAFSVRARPGLGVSIPCRWDELEGLTGGDHWNITTAHERLEWQDDPWADYAAMRQTLTTARKTLARLQVGSAKPAPRKSKAA